MVEYIPDEKLVRIPIRDNGEKLIAVEEECPDIKVILPDYLLNNSPKFKKAASMVRTGVCERLKQANDNLPRETRLILHNGFRPIEIQKEKFEWLFLRVKEENPDWSDKEVRAETGKYIGDPDIVPPHTTGGAVDVALADKDGELLNMGSPLAQKDLNMFTCAKNISDQARKNRELLCRVMKDAGFVNYPLEWWHFSYGDRYWAAALGKNYSIYDTYHLDDL